MRFFDVCNGDADGLIARHQFRLSVPVASDDLTLVTGPKRDITLLSNVKVNGPAAMQADVSVFDISYDQNEESARRLLDAGATIRYFDHHRANLLRPHERLFAHIDTSPDTCTSLIVDRHLDGAHRHWAIAAAFGDNLTEVAEQLAIGQNLPAEKTLLLRQLGECINYNAYGEKLSDLHYPPQEIARRMMPYQSPFEFVEREDIFSCLQIGFVADLQLAQTVLPIHSSSIAAVYVLPDERWARRVSGVFANTLVRAHTCRAHAVLSPVANGTYTVSIRAPHNNPQSADTIAIQFDKGGGRAAAAGIEDLADRDITRLISFLENSYGRSTA